MVETPSIRTSFSRNSKGNNNNEKERTRERNSRKQQKTQADFFSMSEMAIKIRGPLF